MRAAAAVGLALAVLALPGCKKTLDTSDIEGQVSSSKLGFTNVSCPSDVEARAGNNFTCSATSPDGKPVTLEIVQKDDSGSVSVLPASSSTTD